MIDDQNLGNFISRNSDELRIKVGSKTEVYKSLKVFEFTSDRRMMTRVVKNVETGEVLVITKGADSAIIPICSNPDQNIINEIENFSLEGFRTLAFATKTLPDDQIDGYLTQEEIESGLTLLAGTGVEDLLQLDVVPVLQ